MVRKRDGRAEVLLRRELGDLVIDDGVIEVFVILLLAFAVGEGRDVRVFIAFASFTRDPTRISADVPEGSFGWTSISWIIMLAFNA